MWRARKPGLCLFQSDDSELKHAFCIFDKNGDGYISRSELKEALANLGEDFGDDEIEFMIKEADTGINLTWD